MDRIYGVYQCSNVHNSHEITKGMDIIKAAYIFQLLPIVSYKSYQHSSSQVYFVTQCPILDYYATVYQ